MRAGILLFLISILTASCTHPTPGSIRQENVYERCLKTESTVGAGVGIDYKGNAIATTTVSSICTHKQEVWTTERYEFDEWKIIKIELREL